MAEVNTPRLMAAAKEFNIGKDTLTDFLVSKGFDADDLKPTSKISEAMYRVLQVEFQPDKVAKQKAEQIDLPKNAPSDGKKRRDEQDLSFNKKETVKPKEIEAEAEAEVAVESQEEIPAPIVEEKVEETPPPVAVTEIVESKEEKELPVIEIPPVPE